VPPFGAVNRLTDTIKYSYQSDNSRPSPPVRRFEFLGQRRPRSSVDVGPQPLSVRLVGPPGFFQVSVNDEPGDVIRGGVVQVTPKTVV
jgi:hypothetical protein